ncbi:MAG: CoA pyrophosphatase [Spirochaetaceae bacterium]|nr:CoA pyrophosphatase [Spirochaetaceae bacterium]
MSEANLTRPVTAQRFVDAFARGGHGEPRAEHEITAAVCVVLGGADAAPALCFIKRSERADDPWSGQMAFPGGRVARTDATPRAAAARETAEEVGLDLTRCRYLGALPPMPITRRGRPHLGWLQPFVHLCSPDLPELRPQPSEVAAALWIPLAHLTDPEQGTSVEIADGERRLVFPGIAYGGEVIWGLTYRVLGSLLDLARSQVWK